MNNTKKYVLTFAKNDKGEDIKYRFLLSLGQKIKDIEKEINAAVLATDGIDNFNILGRYTMEVSISLAFDAEEVLAIMTPKIDAALTGLIIPKPTLVI